MPREYLPHPSLLQRLYFIFLLYFCKVSWSLAFTLGPYIKPALFPPPSSKKTYPQLPKHPVYFYYPSSPPPQGRKYPLYINIHGGAFTYGTPLKDTRFCSALTEKLQCVTASISYRKAPRHPFPTAIYDAAALITAILDDPEVTSRVDIENVVLGGFSAGGCLTMALPQLPEFKNTFRGAVAWYPKVDSTLTFEEETAGGKIVDPYMALFKPAFEWGTIRRARCNDPLMSAEFADVDTIPQRLMMVSGRLDMFYLESERFIDRIVRVRYPGGREEEMNEKWTKVQGGGGKITGWWVEGVGHSFTHKPPKEDAAIRVTAEVVDGVGEWMRSVFGGKI